MTDGPWRLSNKITIYGWSTSHRPDLFVNGENSLPRRESTDPLGGVDVLRIWVCRAEAAEKFLGTQVVLGASHLFSLVTHRSL